MPTESCTCKIVLSNSPNLAKALRSCNVFSITATFAQIQTDSVYRILVQLTRRPMRSRKEILNFIQYERVT